MIENFLYKTNYNQFKIRVNEYKFGYILELVIYMKI